MNTIEAIGDHVNILLSFSSYRKLVAIGNLAPKRFMIDAYSVAGMVVCVC